MNENLNLVELLKNVPIGTKFHHAIYGDVTLDRINAASYYPINLLVERGLSASVTDDGRTDRRFPKGECLLFPSSTQRDWSVWAREQEEAKKQLLPIGTPVMVCLSIDGRIIEDWRLRCYAVGNKCFDRGYKPTDEVDASAWEIIIPFDKFDPRNIEESLKHNVVK